MTGFITWPRSMEEDFPWYRTPNALVLFLHLLTKANIRDSFFLGKKVERGCVVTSIARLSEETGLTAMQVRTAIDHLTSTGDVIKESNNHYTLLRIPNFDTFNGNKQVTNGQQAGNEQVTSGQQHKEEEDKEEKKEVTSLSDSVKSVVDVWNERCGGALKISRISPQSTRYKSLSARIDEYGLDDVMKAVGNVAESKFLKESTWFSFDWFVKPNNFVKVLDGNYSDRRTGKSDSAGPKTDEPTMTDADRQRVRDDYSAKMLRGDY